MIPAFRNNSCFLKKKMYIWKDIFTILKLFKLAALLTVCLVFSVPVSESAQPPFFSESNATFDQVYSDVVANISAKAYHYQLQRTSETKDTTILRLKIETSKDATVQHPIYATVIQPKVLSSSFEVPFKFRKGQQQKSISDDGEQGPYYHAERTLCILEEDDNNDDSVQITIVISTRSVTNVSFRLVVTKAQDFLLSLNQPRTIQLSPASPVYYGFSFDRAVGHQKVKVLASADNETDSYCTTISIQTFSCPIFDLEQTVNYEGKWKTITSSGVMTIEKDSPTDHGFIVVLVAHSSHDLCLRRDPFSVPISGASSINGESDLNIFTGNGSGVMPSDPYGKAVTLNISSSVDLSSGEVLVSVLLPFGVTLAIALASSVFLFFFSDWRCNDLPQGDPEVEGTPSESSQSQQSTSSSGSNNLKQGSSYRSRSVTSANQLDLDEDRPQLVVNGNPDPDPDSDSPLLGFRIPDLPIRRSSVKLADFENICKVDRRYTWLTGTVGWYYIVPVCQFAIFYYRIFINVGDYDVCYYNDRCSNPVGPFVDFNHLWSNTSYVVFGIAYIVVVKTRRRMVAKWDEEFMNGYGVRHTFGLMYALGISLIIEGVLSAIYHLCPNQSTFQFDTCFMYVIAILIHLKVYHNRHPGFCKPESTYLLLASMLTLPVIELVFEAIITPGRSDIYFGILLTVQFPVMILLAVHYCLIGYVNNERNKPITGLELLLPCNMFCLENWRKVSWRRYIIPVILIGTSIFVLVFGKMKGLPVSSYVLYSLVANTLATIGCYVLLKFLNKEFRNYSWVLPGTFLGLGLGLGAWAVVYFMDTASEWNLPPSASRKLNTDCKDLLFPLLPRFYDGHDFWHFLSAAALFFTFMGLLVLDNDLTNTPRVTIDVF